MDTKTKRRLAATLNHLFPSDESGSATGLGESLTAGESDRMIDVGRLRSWLDGDEVRIRNATRDLIASNHLMGYQHIEQPKELQRELTLLRTQLIGKSGLLSTRDQIDDPAKFYAVLETLSYYDFNLLTKMAVHFALFLGSVLKLGSERHAEYLEPAGRVDWVGCFLMTEIGHGSNVRGVETTATYEPSSDCFILHSPTPSATKFWIGGAGAHARYGVTFARLILGSTDHGVHVFITQLRDESGSVLPGITIRDCGFKEGLNGVDNGAVSFSHYSIPRTNLLNKFADVNERGVYVGPKEPVNFGLTVGALSSGRLMIAGGSASLTKVVATIGLRHAFARRQFGPMGNETPIINYTTHRVRLLPILARAISHDRTVKAVMRAWVAGGKDARSDLHGLTASLKARVTWAVLDDIQTVRECLGGQGLRVANRIAEVKADADVFVTFEGDNTVLSLAVARYLLDAGSKAAKSGFKGALSHLNKAASLVAKHSPSGCWNDVSWVRSLFLVREATTFKALSDNMTKAIKSGSRPGPAFEAHTLEALAAARAFYDRLATASFGADVDALGSCPNKSVMADLAHLDALTRVQSELGSFLCAGLVDRKTGSALRGAIVDLCAKLTPHALSICDGFGIPEKCLPDAACIRF